MVGLKQGGGGGDELSSYPPHEQFKTGKGGKEMGGADLRTKVLGCR